MKAWFFVTFDITISHIFPENFIEIPQVMKNFSVNISYFYFGFFDIFLLERNLWRQLITDDVSIFSLSPYFKQIV